MNTNTDFDIGLESKGIKILIIKFYILGLISNYPSFSFAGK